jgi:hypothetical protein
MGLLLLSHGQDQVRWHLGAEIRMELAEVEPRKLN